MIEYFYTQISSISVDVNKIFAMFPKKKRNKIDAKLFSGYHPQIH